MRNLEIKDLHYEDLSSKQMSEISGGGFGLTLLLGALVATVEEIISDWDNFERGLSGQKYQPKSE